MKELGESNTDKRVKLYKAFAGLIPGGSFIAELGIDKIPEQRLDRVIDFVEKLESRIKKLETKSFTSDQQFGYLAENSLLESAKAYSAKRRSWLAAICVPLRDPPYLEEWELRISSVAKLASLSDAEVDYLLGYADPTRSFRLRHRQEDRHVFISDADNRKLPSQELFEKTLLNTEKVIHRDSLLRLGLLNFKDDGSFETYELTNSGKLFIYILTGNMVR
ncbi:hypothetical protein BN1049_01840 [Pseudomonas saudimassiliensis]|uniref:Uncharacterized protein n=1 Tax=Pseudomonas saudimassiliensis TaxID=1461581 RepID=A0A078MC76_9PSED|nr:hypothetical protein [Pseudomonas saudimassiliensis]CEA05003.1 hypothetical protein BN1049_01840 [Pseudomonas saudimassiliensis]CEF26906.1 hypothetical protein BN1049_01840 [Pseudomonas saudimassiliensis]